MAEAPLGIYYSVGTFYPCDATEAGEHETSRTILKELRIIPDCASVEDGLARMHWRFCCQSEARQFWLRGLKHFPALPWNLLHNPAWAAQAAVPDAMPDDL